MADRPQGGGPPDGSPDYHWLYGSQGGQPSGDETRAIPQQPRDDETQVMPAGARDARSRHDSPPPAAPRPAAAPAAAKPVKPAKPARSRPRFRAKWLWAVLLVWLVFLVAVPIWAWTTVEKVDALPSEGARIEDQPGTTYLVVGSDKADDLTEEQKKEVRAGERSGQRTDTILLLHTGDGPNLLMSIPRDTPVDIPGQGSNKINAAFSIGGPQLLVRTIESSTGIQVDHYVDIGFGGVINMVDAVGGVEVCPKTAMKDPDARLDIGKGCQEADGLTALA